ncbi:hypothetical protein SNE40_003737 [Patella caerulea]|uniref:Uncharacterized protein n=1 Tax=Patella caerulea TaxID=87958 RepID=A0AAN8QFL5_PATCE
MASSSKRKLSEEEVMNTILESDDDLSSYVDTEDEIDDRDEAYLMNASAIDTESEPEVDVPCNLNASSNDNAGVSRRPRAREPRVPDRDWSPHGQARDRFTFTGNPGLKVNIDDPEYPLEFF